MSISRQFSTAKMNTPAPEPRKANVEKSLAVASHETGAFEEVKAQVEEIEKDGARKGVLSVRIDLDIIAWLKSKPDWRSTLNKALRAQMEASRP